MGFSIGRSGIRRGSQRKRRRALFARLSLTGIALGLFALAGWPEQGAAPVAPPVASAPAAQQRLAVRPSVSAYSVLLDARPTLGLTPLPLAEQAPLRAAFVPTIPDPMQTASLAPDAALSRHQPDAAIAPSAAAPLPLPLTTSRLLENARLPVPRPSDLKPPVAAETRPSAPAADKPAVLAEKPRPAGGASRRAKSGAVASAAPEDNRNFMQKLFGVQPREAGVALAYAAPRDEEIDRGGGLGLGMRLSPRPSTPVPSSVGPGTAVYDIKARTVYLPNGERLEAHSGLGDKMDDVRFAHVRMQGVTPPHVYNLVEREALFHGVRAIRLHPVGGSRAIHGRAGLLAHNYLLGPNGQSNGCVSLKDYDRFLQAYLRGEIRRLVVVAG